MRVNPRHTFSLTAYAKVILINAFSVCDQTSRQQSLKSKQPIFIIMFLLWFSAHRSLTGTNIFSLQPVNPKVMSTTILDKIEWNSKPYPPARSIKTKPRKSPNRQFFPSLIFFCGGGRRINFQSLLPNIAAWLNSICNLVAGVWILHCIGFICFAKTAERIFRLC